VRYVDEFELEDQRAWHRVEATRIRLDLLRLEEAGRRPVHSQSSIARGHPDAALRATSPIVYGTCIRWAEDRLRGDR
jgi:hypothetical protein